MTRASIASAVALLRSKARRCRLAAFKMNPSPARLAIERIADRWDMIAQAQGRLLPPQPANEP